MPRYKLTLEYEGTNLVGWQRQKEGASVQSILEKAFYDFTQEEVRAYAAGRTDAGVHARGQVVHMDIGKSWPVDKLLRAANAHLKGTPVAVVNAQEVPDSFHARFSALHRSYEYRLIIRPSPLVLDRYRAWWYHSPLKVNEMRRAAQLLLGTHDFSTFRASECQSKSPIRSLDRLGIDVINLKTCDDHKSQNKEKISDQEQPHNVELLFRIQAKSFLHHQVRNIVGSLKLVGTGKWSLSDFEDALNAKDRRRGGPTAPACGLTFVSVAY